jgi:hypothetical protein
MLSFSQMMRSMLSYSKTLTIQPDDDFCFIIEPEVWLTAAKVGKPASYALLKACTQLMHS